jgi:hypothetical protein
MLSEFNECASQIMKPIQRTTERWIIFEYSTFIMNVPQIASQFIIVHILKWRGVNTCTLKYIMKANPLKSDW